MDLGRRETHFIGKVIAGRGDAAQDFAHFGFVVDEAQQRLATRPRTADAENIFGGRVQVDDEKIVVEQDDTRTQAVDDSGGVAAEWSVAGPATFQRTVACWT
jgi:hypothetical protein